MKFKLNHGDWKSVELAYLCLFLLLLPATIFLTNAPVWDDSHIFVRHAIWDWNALLGPFVGNETAYWRPLTVITIAVPNLIGVSIWANKLINVFLMFVQGSLAIALLGDYFGSRKTVQNLFPLIALAILLALHPIFVETTLWISARADLLMGVFVMLGVLWICRQHVKQSNAQEPTPAWSGLLIGFFIVWLACAAKDTGIVWAGLAIIAATVLSVRSKGAWRKYWGYSAAGIMFANVTYLLVRGAVLGQINGLSSVVARHANSAGERFQFFVEFIFRSILAIFIPFLDPAPFKSAGWFAGIQTVWLAALLVACVGCTCFLLIRLYKTNKIGAYLSVCAIVVIVFYAVVVTFSEPTVGSILSDRYLAPSAVLVYLVMAMQLQDVNRLKFASRQVRFNIPVALVFGLLVMQSLVLWTSARMSWGSNLALWESAWNQKSQSRIVAGNYFTANFHLHDFSAARSIAQTWLAQNKTATISPENCVIYLDILDADLSLGDQEDGIRYAKQSIPIGWCRPKLAKDIAYFLMESNCKEVLPMIYLTIAEMNNPNRRVKGQFSNPGQKEPLLIYAAFGEARCGDDTKALELVNSLAKINPEWASNGEKARNLLNQAHTALGAQPTAR